MFPVFPRINPRVNLSSNPLQSIRRSMSQFLIVAHDHTDPDAIHRRIKVRPDHITGIRKMVQEGTFITGGALLSDTEVFEGKPKMIGSMVLVKFDSLETAKAYVAQDPYTVGKVWDKIQVTPFRVAETGVIVENL